MEMIEKYKKAVEFIASFGLDWFRGEAIKYLYIFPYNHGVEDLHKAVEVLTILLSDKVSGEYIKTYRDLDYSISTSIDRDFPKEECNKKFKNSFFTMYHLKKAICNILEGNIKQAINDIDKLKYIEYDEL